jgi:hypothetical protein
MAAARKPSRLRRAAFAFAGFWLASVVVLLLLEGAASVWSMVRAVWSVREPLAERSHTQYDELLGWSHVPSVHLPDLYGPGQHLTTNAQGLRARREYSAEVPAGKIRVVCSGDSFTLGYGVDDALTWPAQMEALDPRLETLNMGQGGYGIDQAYLWYQRDGGRWQHDVHVFAFLSEGFRRMKGTRFVGYPKPRLRLRDGELVTENVPVPRGALQRPLQTQWSLALNNLALYRCAQRLAQSWLGLGEEAAPLGEGEVRAAAMAAFGELQRQHDAHGRILLLVHLPVPDDYDDPKSDLLRYYLAAECAKRGHIYVDLIEEMRRLPREQARALHLWHFSPAGNRWAAEQLLRRLRPLLEARSRSGTGR